jgi:SAM-dependent methyltransferase
VGDVTKPDLLSKKKFYVIICSEVLEHIEDDRLAIKHLYNLLKPGGCVIITVPHLKKYWSHHDTSDGHVRRYEKDALENMLNDMGFAVYENFDWGYPLFHLYSELILKRAKKNMVGDVSKMPVLKYLLSKILILFFYFDDLFMNSDKGRTIFMICKKREKNKTNVSGDTHE